MPRASMLLTLTTIILFGCSQKVVAQQKGGEESNSSSSTGNSGPTRPNINFNILTLLNGEYLEMFGANNSRGILRGHPTIPGAELGTTTADPLIFSTGGVERMRIFPNGFITIGATFQGAPLEFATPAAVAYAPNSTQGARFRLTNTTSTLNNVMEINLGSFDNNGGVSTRVRLASISTDQTPNATSGDFVIGLRSAGTLFESARFLSNGRVGIGTATPAHKLDVQGGAINASGGLCMAGDCKTDWSQVGGPGSSQWTTAGTSIFYNTGNVGIGTTTPNRRLELVQDVGGISFEAGTGSPNSGVIRFGDNSGWKFHFGRSRDSVGGALNSGTSGVLMTIQDNGNVGIGTPNPSRKLHLATNSIQSLDGILLQSLDGHFSLSAPSLGQGNYNNITQAGDIGIIYGNGITPGTGSFVIATWAFATSGLRMDGNGNVGIGTPTTNFKLDVNGEINATGFRINGTPISTGPSGAVSSVFGRTGVVVQQAGDYTWAQINKSTSSLADIATRSAGDLSSGTLPDARFPTTLPAVSGANLTTLNASNLANGTVPIARLGSGTADSTKFLRGDNTWAVPSGTSQWTTSGTSIFYNSGNVGIGTASPPTEKLEVIGNIKVSGNINAKYQDVAEWVDSSQELVAGTVVVLDSSRSNHVIAATQSYDSRIAGVISQQPGLTLGEEAEGRVLVATTGRVRVKVDATEGPIQIGDLLVTSNREGFAMKSLPVDVGGVRMHRPGTLIGKALEPLAKGTGEILVLLSLQ